ncbi:hypothetical protein Slu03_16370 [Sediminihabitans luteus]|nr:hypothetical protein Slu03_16370 [Sediminihabitans luteus]
MAGAAGTAVIDAVTYLDMALRGRDPSSVPQGTVDALADRAGTSVPGDGATAENRRTALGALAGTATGLGVGVLASVARRAGLRTGPAAGAVLIGGAAMAAADLPVAALGVSDPGTWSRADWAADVVPHLAYGLTTHLTLDALASDEPPAGRARPALLARSAALGLASGARASLGVAAPVLTSPGGGRGRAVAKAGIALGVVGELVGDKQPTTPSRLDPPGPQVRVAAGALGGVALARRAEARPLVPMAVGAAAAAVGTRAGAAWRAWAVGRVPDWQAAVAEDVAALALAAVACVGGRPGSGTTA